MTNGASRSGKSFTDEELSHLRTVAIDPHETNIGTKRRRTRRHIGAGQLEGLPTRRRCGLLDHCLFADTHGLNPFDGDIDQLDGCLGIASVEPGIPTGQPLFETRVGEQVRPGATAATGIDRFQSPDPLDENSHRLCIHLVSCQGRHRATSIRRVHSVVENRKGLVTGLDDARIAGNAEVIQRDGIDQVLLAQRGQHVGLDLDSPCRSVFRVALGTVDVQVTSDPAFQRGGSVCNRGGGENIRQAGFIDRLFEEATSTQSPQKVDLLAARKIGNLEIGMPGSDAENPILRFGVTNETFAPGREVPGEIPAVDQEIFRDSGGRREQLGVGLSLVPAIGQQVPFFVHSFHRKPRFQPQSLDLEMLDENGSDGESPVSCLGIGDLVVGDPGPARNHHPTSFAGSV